MVSDEALLGLGISLNRPKIDQFFFLNFEDSICGDMSSVTRDDMALMAKLAATAV